MKGHDSYIPRQAWKRLLTPKNNQLIFQVENSIKIKEIFYVGLLCSTSSPVLGSSHCYYMNLF